MLCICSLQQNVPFIIIDKKHEKNIIMNINIHRTINASNAPLPNIHIIYIQIIYKLYLIYFRIILPFGFFHIDSRSTIFLFRFTWVVCFVFIIGTHIFGNFPKFFGSQFEIGSPFGFIPKYLVL